jgi:hypothetical protein
MRSVSTLSACCGALLALSGPPAQAAFQLVDDFEALVAGSPIAVHPAWTDAAGSGTVVADLDGSANQALAVATESSWLYRPLTVVNGSTHTLFLRFAVGSQQNVSFGLSDLARPAEINDFEVELNVANDPVELRISTDVVGDKYTKLTGLDPRVWYNLWLLVDNAAEQTSVYLHARDGQAATDSDLLGTFLFRQGGAGDLRSFFIKSGGGASGNVGPLYLDDLFLEDNVGLPLGGSYLNPSNPSLVPIAPSVLMLASALGVSALGYGRRRGRHAASPQHAFAGPPRR